MIVHRARAQPSTPVGRPAAVPRSANRGNAPLPTILVLAVVAVLGGACEATPAGSAAPTAHSPSPNVARLGVAELRLLLIERFGPLWFCDPDAFPVAHDEMESMRAAWPDLLADPELLSAILHAIDLPPIVQANLTDEQRLSVYRLWKVASAIPLELIGNGRYRFDYLAQPGEGGPEGTRTAGIIDDTGHLTIEVEVAASEPVCPICLAAGTLIDTPAGPVEVEDLRLGAPIWTLDREGRRIAGTVIALGSTAAPPGHRVIRLTLEDGRTVTASAGHPLADGRPLGLLSVGDTVDDSHVIGLEQVSYADARTFDLVVSGPTGVYLGSGIPLATTLR